MSEKTSERKSKRPSERVNETKKHRAKEVRVIKRVQLFGFLLAHTYSDYYKLQSYIIKTKICVVFIYGLFKYFVSDLCGELNFISMHG